MNTNPSINMTTSIHFGVVEDRDTDKRKLGRCKVRVVGVHTEDKTELPTKDLPWAYPMMPTHSASMNGIGYSPTGVVEGTWCIIIFRDEYKQHPVIIGTIGGIPEEFEDQKVEKITTQRGTAGAVKLDQVAPKVNLRDSQGNVVLDSQGEPVQVTAPENADIKNVSQMSLSSKGRDAIKKFKPPATDDQINAAEAAAKSAIKVPVTQGMFDATVSMMADAGVDPITKSQFMNALNGGKYEEAAALIPNTSVSKTTSGAAVSNPKQSLKDALGARESNNNYQAVNQLGYMGKYQMGAAMLTDLGYVKRGTTNRQLNDPSVYTGKDGINSKEDFLGNSAVQEKAMDAELAMNEKRLRSMGVIDANSSQQEVSGFLAVSHLLGTGGARNLKNGTNGKDANGASGQSYYDLGAKSAGAAPKDPASVARRSAEQKMFLADGIPAKDASTVNPVADSSSTETTPDKTSNPVVTPLNGQSTVKEGTTGSSSSTIISAEGFRDPKKFYPKKDWLNEPDTHRLARHEKIDQTIVKVKEAARVTGVPMAFGPTWSQPPIPYNAKYPFNQTRVTESGHVEEWDDTKDNERIHRYHIAGTFEEVDKNGTRVTRIVGDDYEILERNGHVLIKGNCTVTIKGDSRVRVENNAYVQVLGDCNTAVTGDWEIGVGGSVLANVGGIFSVDAGEIHLNSGESSGVEIPSERGSPVKMGTLTNPSRSGSTNANYETPEEGDPSMWYAAQVAAGNITPAAPQPNLNLDQKTAEQKTDPAGPVPPSTVKCAEIDPGMQLSKYFKLGDLTRVGQSGTPECGKTYYGLPAEKIVSNMKSLSNNVLDPIKAKYPNMTMTSVWRSEAVNRAAGGSTTSDHLTGCAADLQFSGFSREQTYQTAIDIQKMLPSTHQIILEYKGSSTWIHVSYKDSGNKNEVLTMDAASNTVISRGSFVLK